MAVSSVFCVAMSCTINIVYILVALRNLGQKDKLMLKIDVIKYVLFAIVLLMFMYVVQFLDYFVVSFMVIWGCDWP